MFICDGFSRRGKNINAFEVVQQAIAKCPTIEKVFIVSESQLLNFLKAHNIFTMNSQTDE